MEVRYALECGHVRRFKRHVKLFEGTYWCRRCKDHKKVTHIGVTPRLSKFLKRKKK
jgi:hypothetical protein